MATKDLTKSAKEIITSFNSKNWTAIESLLTPDVLYNEVGTGRRFNGPDPIINALKEWKKSMSDAKGNVTNAFYSGTYVTLEVTWTGTQDGPFPGPAGTFPPSGKRQTTPSAMILKFQGNKVKEMHHYFDMLSFLQQIGAMPTAARA